MSVCWAENPIVKNMQTHSEKKKKMQVSLSDHPPPHEEDFQVFHISKMELKW